MESNKSPFFLLTNDDGIETPGLEKLREIFQKMGDVLVCAPSAERSASGHAVTIKRDVAVEECRKNGETWGYALDGTPADCVKFALTTLKLPRPDLVISGINPGPNTGNNILYSGTVAAAVEAAMYQLPAMAVSISYRKDHETIYYESVERYLPPLARLVLQKGLPPNIMLNVNFPNRPPDEIEDVVVTKQGHAWYEDDFQPFSRENGRTFYRNVGAQFIHSQDDADSDDHAIRHRKISVTPLRFDMTDHDFREKLAGWPLSIRTSEK